MVCKPLLVVFLVSLLTCISCSFVGTNTKVIRVNPNGNSSITLRGCQIGTVERRPLYHGADDFWEKLNPIDALIIPEANVQTGVAPDPDYIAAWSLLEKILKNCSSCSHVSWVQIYQRAAYIKYSIGDNAAAIMYFQKVLEQSPYMALSFEANVTYKVAEMLAQEGEYIESIEYYDRWEKFCDREIPESYFRDRASVHIKVGDRVGATYYQSLEVEQQ